MTIYWRCYDCPATGSYDAATAPKTDERLPDAKHANTEGHCTTTTTLGPAAWRDGRVREVEER